MVTRTPTAEQARVAMQRIEPFLGRYSSSWCRQVLYSTLHHTSGAFDQRALTSEQLGVWLNTEPWPTCQRRDIYDTEHVHWCEDCLKCGYHFFGHQLVGLVRCPLHNTPMRCGCPKCDFALLMRSRSTLECREPLRNCMHCHQPILSVTDSFKWPKTAKFLQLEHEALCRFIYWARRVDRLHYRLARHTEGTCIKFSPKTSSKEYARLAIEAVCPLPRSIATEPPPSGLGVTVVVLDTRLVQEAVVPAQVRSLMVSAMLSHLGDKPLPAEWIHHWRTFEAETPIPANAGASAHFAYWKELINSGGTGFRPTGPTESLRPCMLPLLAARVVGQFNGQANSHDDSDLPASFFFSNREATLANVPLGDLPGIIVELHSGCNYAAFRLDGGIDTRGPEGMRHDRLVNMFNHLCRSMQKLALQRGPRH